VITSIAVLPLASLSAQPDRDFVVEGLHEALITELSKIRSVRVISRTSAERYRDADTPLGEVGRSLGVDAVVRGSVLRSGNRLRVSTQLVQVDPERHLWADNFDRELTDVLFLTSDVAQAVAREIRVTLTPAESEHLARATPVNPEAYELYARGRHHWNQRTLDGYRLAIEHLEKAIALDPGYAPAYAALADSYMLLGEQGGMRQNEARALSEAAIREALEKDDALAEAYASLGHWKFYYDWNWTEAEQAFTHAIELNPSYAAAHQLYGRALGFMGRFDEGMKELQRARELDPLSVTIHAYIGQVHIYSRQYGRAIEHLKSALELNPNHALLRHNMGEALVAERRFAEAVEELERSVALSPVASAHYLAILGCGYAGASRKTKAIEILDRLTERYTQGLVASFDLASLYAALGDRERAMSLLEEAYAGRDLWLAEIKGWPWFDSLASDPRYKALVSRMRFPKS
jgi:TolB-like protein/Tfp pilus assembly protein PilF